MAHELKFNEDHPSLVSRPPGYAKREKGSGEKSRGLPCPHVEKLYVANQIAVV